ncbi:YfiT family bacillithiol transferase [Arcicella rosea]|uniref:Putative damage-inducible protein DinB n=1 Tax=Arcicella rosea TaxID=502909 RepID=A0A841EQB3_9BACT|nr:bacillithiol transferase BstA [Arcicella rosea]MBB6001621.1 putative damage-inducible protein DinB [Arcicella rosea]
MENLSLEKLRYPIGAFTKPTNIDDELLNEWIEDIEALPTLLKQAVEGLSDEQLSLPYRPEGWTLRQTVNHVADSHINAYCRFKLALTEDTPTIRPYEEQFWAELEDGRNAPIEWSLTLLEALHKRWTVLLKSLTKEQFERTFVHPASGDENTLRTVTGMYSWHGRHHTAHITELRKRLEI